MNKGKDRVGPGRTILSTSCTNVFHLLPTHFHFTSVVSMVLMGAEHWSKTLLVLSTTIMTFLDKYYHYFYCCFCNPIFHNLFYIFLLTIFQISFLYSHYLIFEIPVFSLFWYYFYHFQMIELVFLFLLLFSVIISHALVYFFTFFYWIFFVNSFIFSR